jgi:prevent-host-death family protein
MWRIWRRLRRWTSRLANETLRLTILPAPVSIFISAKKVRIMILPNDIHTLDSFRRKTRQYIDRLQSTGRPEVLTVNGKPSVVVQDASAYQRQNEKIAVLEALAESVKQADTGKVRDARKAIGKLLSELKSR